MIGADVIVIGGGLVGASIAWGIARTGRDTILLDEGDTALRASRGNFGLVWVQGKGLGCPEYAQWSLRSADLWPDFAAELGEQTGIDVGHERPGGVLLNLSDEEEEANARTLQQIRLEAGNKPYEYEVLGHDALRDLLPGIGPDVVSGSYSSYDGHANPLYLLRALHSGFAAAGGRYLPSHRVNAISSDGGTVTVAAGGTHFTAGKVVISAGLATQQLAEKVGLAVPMQPLHGQIIVTERTGPQLSMPTNLVRQTREGVMMLGYTVDDFGYDTATRPDRSRNVAHGALKAFPFLRDLRVVRSWAALRIMTEDGFPIYDMSASHPGVYVATCHSGVTLAAVHARDVARWITEDEEPEGLARFSTGRFDVQEVA